MPYYYRDPNAPKPTLPRAVGVCALIELHACLLLDHRRDGRWGLIGGAVDDDESLGAALCREVFEETGLTVRSYRLFGTFSDPSRIIQYGDGQAQQIVTLVYWAEVESFDGLRVSDESREVRLVPRAVLPTLDIAETHRHIVDDYLDGGGREQPLLK